MWSCWIIVLGDAYVLWFFYFVEAERYDKELCVIREWQIFGYVWSTLVIYIKYWQLTNKAAIFVFIFRTKRTRSSVLKGIFFDVFWYSLISTASYWQSCRTRSRQMLWNKATICFELFPSFHIADMIYARNILVVMYDSGVTSRHKSS